MGTKKTPSVKKKTEPIQERASVMTVATAICKELERLDLNEASDALAIVLISWGYGDYAKGILR